MSYGRELTAPGMGVWLTAIKRSPLMLFPAFSVEWILSVPTTLRSESEVVQFRLSLTSKEMVPPAPIDFKSEVRARKLTATNLPLSQPPPGSCVFISKTETHRTQRESFRKNFFRLTGRSLRERKKVELLVSMRSLRKQSATKLPV